MRNGPSSLQMSWVTMLTMTAMQRAHPRKTSGYPHHLYMMK